MLRYLCSVVLVVFAVVEDSCSRGVSEETQKLITKMIADGEIKVNGDCKSTEQSNDELIETQAESLHTGVKFKCPVSSEERSTSSVHALRPEDIDVVAAVGDSYTAAFGAGAKYIGPDAFVEHRGLSFSIGGDETLETHVTVPNILKKYNPDVYGFSEGIGTDNSNMNTAVSGATSEDLSDMVDELIERLVDDPLVDMEEDWKLITIFIGGNDIFDSCLRPRFTPELYKEMITACFNTLKAMVPRALVNVLPIPSVVDVKKMTGLVCDTVHMSMCPCLYAGEEAIDKIIALTEEYNVVLEEVTSGGDFDTDDFAIVFQPYTATAYVPELEDGSGDQRYFAPDCLHLSKLGHATGAFYLWSNMLEPVNAKVTVWSPEIDEYLPCPTSPYIFTNGNSVVTQAGETDVLGNKQATSNSLNPSSLGRGTVAVIALIAAAIVLTLGYVSYRHLYKARWSYERL